MAWKQDWYVLQKPEKYINKKKTRIFYKSNLEQRVFYFCDNNLNVLRWEYEGMTIPYLRPVFLNWKLHHVEKHEYVPDLYVEIKENDGKIGKYLIEIKSKSDTIAPQMPKRRTQKSLRQFQFKAQQYAVNSNKWSAAEKWCRENGITWKIIMDDKIW